MTQLMQSEMLRLPASRATRKRCKPSCSGSTVRSAPCWRPERPSRQRQAQRDRETERQRDRETERQRDRETERQRDRETERRDREGAHGRRMVAGAPSPCPLRTRSPRPAKQQPAASPRGSRAISSRGRTRRRQWRLRARGKQRSSSSWPRLRKCPRGAGEWAPPAAWTPWQGRSSTGGAEAAADARCD